MLFSRRLRAIVVRLASWRQDGVDTLYVGCGNRFDDDRRLVRIPLAVSAGDGEFPPSRSAIPQARRASAAEGTKSRPDHG
jgi:hypothetical protein